jgi:hypothetical protein
MSNATNFPLAPELAPHAAWAGKSHSALHRIAGAIIRFQPMGLFILGLVLCFASGAGLFLLGVLATGAITH